MNFGSDPLKRPLWKLQCGSHIDYRGVTKKGGSYDNVVTGMRPTPFSEDKEEFCAMPTQTFSVRRDR